MKVFPLLLSMSIWASSSYAMGDFSAIDKYVNAAKKEKRNSKRMFCLIVCWCFV